VSTQIFDDLEAEQDRLEEVLAGLPDSAWQRPSGADGWTVADVVLHLAQTEEAVAATVAFGDPGVADWPGHAGSVDEVMDILVRAERGTTAETFQRWRAACQAAVTALRRADPQHPLPWVVTPLKPATLATTRLAEHWAHALDITVPLGIAYPDTARLWHVARLAHRTLPYAFGVAGEPVQPVCCELTAPDGTTWRFGSPDAESSITGPAGAFCRVGARRLAPEDSGLVTRGPGGAVALRLLRTYAA
jgi:uncharacterized protein (TIGR03084 family)